MSEIFIDEEKPKNKYYSDKHREYMRRYREKKTEAYVTCQREASKRHQAKIRDQAKKYLKMVELGLVPIEAN